MASTGTIFTVIIVAVVLLVGGAVGLLYLYPAISHPANTGGSNSSTGTTGSSSGNTSTSHNYTLQLVQSGSKALIASSLTTSVPLTQFKYDGLGNDFGNNPSYTYNYNDNGNLWLLQGDFEPGAAYFNANSSGITLYDQGCSTPYYGQPVRECGPYFEWNGNSHEENVSELSGATYGIPSDAQVFSIYVTLPYYNFNGCEYNLSSTGCSYEGYGPTISALWALDVGNAGSPNSYSVALSLNEFCSQLTGSFGTCVSTTNDLSVGLGTAAFVNNSYDASLSKSLSVNVPSLPYTPNHKLTIATDLHSYFEVWVDNILEYSNTTSPIAAGNNLALNFYQFDNVNNMTLGTTWKNVTVFANSRISVSGLSSGMTVLATGANGFNATATPNSSGTASLDVSNEPANLSIVAELNGHIVATYSGSVSAGAELKLVNS
jgi:hypothetical protein